MDKIYSAAIAFSMYSKIPVPTVEWTKERMKYVMCWFPFIGAAEGVLLYLWLLTASRLGFSHVSAGLIGTAIPLLVTGGIHMDGFLDTMDAKSSYGTVEKKLEILKDPHTGAFAIISCGIYLLLYAGFMTEVSVKAAGLITLAMILERSCSGLSVVTFPCAKSSGLAAAFHDGAGKKACGIILCLWILGCAGAMIYVYQLAGIIVFAIQALVFYYYKKMSIKEFGGITGDLAGYYLQISELAAVAAAAIWM